MPQLPNPQRLPVVGPVQDIKTLAQMIKEADPSMSGVDDATLEAVWKQQYGQRTPEEVLHAQSAPAQDKPQQGFMDRIIEGLTNPDNMPTVKGALSAMATAPLTGGLSIPAALASVFAAGAMGGAIGDINKQTGESPSVMDEGIDPIQTLFSGVEQGLWGAGTEAIMGLAPRRLGAQAYASGTGLNRNQFSQNFPTAAQEGLEGGRFSLPILTASGARRVYDRAAPVPGEMRARAQRAGAPPILPSQIAREGALPVMREIPGGAKLPRTEARAMGNDVSNFIKEHSTITPPSTQWITIEGPGGMSVQIPRKVQGSMIQDRIPVHDPSGRYDIQTLKSGLQRRSADSMKAANADKFPGLQGRTDRALGIGAQKMGEKRVMQTTGEDLGAANRRVQGLTGLNQSLNPSFRTPNELMEMGVDPMIAQTMTSAPTSAIRLWGDAAAAGLGGWFGGPVGFLTAPLVAHTATSPFARRLTGAVLYTGGRAGPTGTNLGRAGMELSDDESEALRRALTGR